MDTRLRSRREFQRVYETGRSFANRRAVLYVLATPGEKRRVAFAAGKRLGHAVIRNRAKRLLREAYRQNMEHLRDDVALVFLARGGMRGARLEETSEALGDLLRRAGVWQ